MTAGQAPAGPARGAAPASPAGPVGHTGRPRSRDPIHPRLTAGPGVQARRCPTGSGRQDVRNYKRKRPPQWRDKDKRMAAAVRKRAEGKSLREIAKELAVSEGTVRNDLARWEREHPANVVPMVRKTSAQSRPAGGEITHPDYAPIASLNARRK